MFRPSTHTQQTSFKAPWLRLPCSCSSTARCLVSSSIHLDYCSLLLNDVVGPTIPKSMCPWCQTNQGQLRVKRHQKERLWRPPVRHREPMAMDVPRAWRRKSTFASISPVRYERQKPLQPAAPSPRCFFPIVSLGGLLLDRFAVRSTEYKNLDLIRYRSKSVGGNICCSWPCILPR